MVYKKKRFKIVIIILLFIVYFFLAARPIPKEVVLTPNWISSLGQTVNQTLTKPVLLKQDEKLLPFTLGAHFGYVDSSGQFAINKVKSSDIYLSQNMWTEYDARPANIEIKNIFEETVVRVNNTGISNTGYPVLLDDRIFILGSEQNALSEISENGNVLWSYEFGAPLTCIDARAGLVLTGSLDGIIEIFNSSGDRIFYFEPGGSRYAVILGCAISKDGSRIGIISGIEQQRFLLLERFGSTGGDYKVVYHEFLDAGFRRPVRILFIDEDRRIVYERAGGIGCYNIRTRRGLFIPLDGAIYAVEDTGTLGFFFLVTGEQNPIYGGAVSGIHSSLADKNLIGIRFAQDGLLPFLKSANAAAIFLKAPFKSDDVFLGRNGAKLVAGGGSALISFELEEK